MKTRTLVLAETQPARITVFPDTAKGMIRAQRLFGKMSAVVDKKNAPTLMRYPVRWASNTLLQGNHGKR